MVRVCRCGYMRNAGLLFFLFFKTVTVTVRVGRCGNMHAGLVRHGHCVCCCPPRVPTLDPNSSLRETLCYSTIPATHCGKWTKRYQQCAINTKHRGENTPCVKLNTSTGHAHWVSTGTADGGHFAQNCPLAKLSKVFGCPDSNHALY